ncbi:MAG TPA: phosphatase PAP2 family protein [Croceibacterium sp.]|nr:phosphatase PAP2 family protein [Croceibacterium sp.]
MGTKARAAEPLLAIDRRTGRLFRPYKDSGPVKALDWFGQAGDQLQLRVLCGGVLALGLVRRDERLVRAAVRMLVSHELATLAKKAVKNRVDRWRPRSIRRGKSVKPRPGSSKAKARNSFPSGHSAGAMAVSCAFAAELPEHRAAALAAGGAVSLAQVPTASHYPSDVVAGAALGAATDAGIGLAWRLAERLWRNHLLAKAPPP